MLYVTIQGQQTFLSLQACDEINIFVIQKFLEDEPAAAFDN